MVKKQNNPNGGVAIITLLVVAVFGMAVMTTLAVVTASESHMSFSDVASEKTFYAAEAGINEGLYELTIDPSPHQFCLDFSGSRISCDSMSTSNTVSIEITAYNKFGRTITSTAQDSSGKKRVIQIQATTSSISVPLEYAVHAGRGGFILDNGAIVKGPVYSNGNIEGDNNSYIYGDVHVANVPTPSPKQESVPQSFHIAQSQENLKAAQQFNVPVEEILTNVSLYIERSSAQPLPESNYFIQIARDSADNPDVSQVIAQEEINIPKDIEWLQVQFNPAPILHPGQSYWLVVGATTQVDNSKYIVWNFNNDSDSYADGQAKYYNNTTGSWVSMPGDFSFQTLLGIGDTFIKDGNVDGDITAHAIIDVVGSGERNDGQNPPRVDYPITESDIAEWKAEAESGGELQCNDGSGCTKDLNGDVTITSNKQIGPNTVKGNLFINQGVDVTLLGNLYVEKNIIFNPPSGATMVVGPTNSPATRVAIAKGTIEIKNNAELHGSGHDKSFLLMISKDDYQLSGKTAIDPAPNSSSVLYFAPYGFIEMANNTFLNSATGYIIHLENGTIEYDDDLFDFTVPDSSPDPIFIGPNQSWEEQ